MNTQNAHPSEDSLFKKALRFPILSETKRYSKEDFKWILKWFLWTVFFCASATALVWYTDKETLFGFASDDMQALEVFVSVFGLAYAVIVGLLIIEAHGRMHELSSALRSELNAISDIHDCLHFFDDENNATAKKNIGDELICYVDRLEEYELDFMKHSRGGRLAVVRYLERLKKAKAKDLQVKKSKKRLNEKKAREIEREIELLKYYLEYRIQSYNRIDPFQTPGIIEILDNVKKLDNNNDIKKSVREKLLDRICDLTNWRTNRLELAEGGLQGYLKVFVVFMSTVIVTGTILLEKASLGLHMFMVCATTAGVVGLFMVLSDVDHPFSGIWQIDKNLLKAIHDKLRGHIEPPEATTLINDGSSD